MWQYTNCEEHSVPPNRKGSAMGATKISRRSIRWNQGFGTRYAFVRTCKLVELVGGLYLVERVGTDLMPCGEVGTFPALRQALEAIAGDPVPKCTGCGRVVAGIEYVTPDPEYPCPVV